MEGTMASILLVAYDFAPKNWAYCAGQTLAISTNQALFSLLGTTYGGNGTTTFALPNLQGRVAIGAGQGPGLPNYPLGSTGGASTVTLTTAQMPAHNHPVNAYLAVSTEFSNGDEADNSFLGNANIYASNPSGSLGGVTSDPTGPTGGNQPISVMQPTLGLHYVICQYGIFPSRN